MEGISIKEHFATLQDPRVERTKQHQLLVGHLPSPVALGHALVIANRTDTARNGVGGRRP